MATHPREADVEMGSIGEQPLLEKSHSWRDSSKMSDQVSQVVDDTSRTLRSVLVPEEHHEKFELKVDINERKDVEHQMEHLAEMKAKLSFLRLSLLGMLSGVWMVLAATFAGTLAAEVSTFQNLVVGAVGPVAMHFIVIFGGEFYSGNCMFYAVGFFKRKVSGLQVVWSLWWSFFWNFVGVWICAWLLCYMTGVMQNEPQLSYVIKGAQAKASTSFMTTFFKAIPANILICTAIQMGISARDMTGKLFSLHFPLTMYLVCGFEHSITNITVVAIGVLHGADISIGNWMLYNLLPSLLGNFVGGFMVVGGFITLLHSWDEGLGHGNLNQPLQKTWEEVVKDIATVPLKAPIQAASHFARAVQKQGNTLAFSLHDASFHNPSVPSQRQVGRDMDAALSQMAKCRHTLEKSQRHPELLLALQSAEAAIQAASSANADHLNSPDVASPLGSIAPRVDISGTHLGGARKRGDRGLLDNFDAGVDAP